ncbi:MAG: hypothetical protein K9M02_14285 [Thiohalocapsa sp.]|nr:hypothetical protein [Thiohalocapsa sp.]
MWSKSESRLRAIPIAAMLIAGSAQAETVTGKINGHGCAHGGHTCPADKLDPHLRFEPDFVLQQGSGEYVFLSNVPRDTKVRYVLEEARAKGEINPRYNTMVVEELAVKKGDSFKTVWTQAAQREAFGYIYGDGWFQFSGEMP